MTVFVGLKHLSRNLACPESPLLARQANQLATPGSCTSYCASEVTVGMAAAGRPGDHSEAGRWGCCGQDPLGHLAERDEKSTNLEKWLHRRTMAWIRVATSIRCGIYDGFIRRIAKCLRASTFRCSDSYPCHRSSVQPFLQVS